MKILKIRLRNIHSLKGDQEIDFTEGPLSRSGIFAITGPTGAGKSTLLDVITLALFSRIPRFDSKITNTEIEKIGSVMTHFADDAYAEVDYSSNSREYRSTWRIAKNRNGNLKDYEMSLATLPDMQFVDLKKSEIPAENEKIIGLNYEQFIRSILLSQGEFAKFLRSDKNERAKLLEHITGSQIYRAIGKAAYEKAKSIKEEIASLKLHISQIPSLTEQQLAEKKNIIQSHKTTITSTNDTLESLQKRLISLEKKVELTSKIALANKEKLALEQRKEKYLPYEVKMKKHQALDTYRGELSLLENEQKRHLETTQQQQHNEDRIKQRTAIMKQALVDMSAFVGHPVYENNFHTEMSNFEKKIIALDTQISHLKDSGQNLRSKLDKLINTQNDSLSSKIKHIKSPEEQLVLVEQQYKLLLESHQHIDTPDEEIKKILAQIQDQIITLHHQHKDIQQREQLAIQSSQLQKDIDQLNQLTQRTQADIVQTDTTISNLELEIAHTQKQKEKQLQITSLDEHRHTLASGEPCPLCGALDHPYTTHLELIQLGSIEIDLHTKTQQLVSHRKALTLHQNTIATNQANITNAQTQFTSFQDQIKGINTLWNDHNASLHSTTIQAQIQKKVLQQNTYTAELEYRSSIKFMVEVRSALIEIIDLLRQFFTTKDKRNKLYTGEDITTDINKIQNPFVAASEVMKELKVNAQLQNESMLALTASIHSRTQALFPAIKELGYSELNEVYADVLEDSILQRIKQEGQELIRLETEIKTTLGHLQQEFKNVQDTPDEDIEKIKTDVIVLNREKDTLHNLIGSIEKELVYDTDNKKIIKKTYDTLQSKEANSLKWVILDKMIGDATGTKYSKYAQNLSLKFLIGLANIRLKRLNDRYLLVPSDIEDDLRVEDLYQGSISRSVKTLSGGESFIVSLALALSLADMASSNVKLESLFIDEGFGTLDADTLETALSTLERLQSETNRTIGIISHVESLKERILTQIQVVKNSQGYSVLEVVG